MNILANWKRLPFCTLVAAVFFAVTTACDTKDQQQEKSVSTPEDEQVLDTTHPHHVSADSTLQKVEEITIKTVGDDLKHIRFSPEIIEVPAGALVTIKLKNQGTEQSMIHNLVITEEGFYKKAALEGAKVGAPGNYIPDNVPVLAASTLALPGQTVEIKFQAPLTPATYDFVCTYPDHYNRMHGKLIVK